MSRGNVGRRLVDHRKLLVLVAVVLATSSLVLAAGLGTSLSNTHQGSWNRVRSPPLARVYPTLTYDEQVGVTFSDNFPKLAFNVTAVAQSDPITGTGPAYLLNGFTDGLGFWYQVGLSYNWPSSGGTALQGFRMSFEVFSPYTLSCNGSVFPTTCGGGLDYLVVNSGDIVQLSLQFSGSNVEMRAHDWNTGSAASESFSSEGASQFVGLDSPANGYGFFTGLMTEQYFSTAYYGAGQQVVYRQTGLVISSGTLWMDEFNTNPLQPVFSDQIPSPVNFSNTVSLYYFASHGTAEAASNNELVTGLTPVVLPSLNLPSPPIGQQGQQATIALNLQNPSGLTIEITSLNVSIGSVPYTTASSAPATITGNSAFTTTILIPSSIAIGNYTLTVKVTFQFRYTQLPDWISAPSISANSTIAITKQSPPNTTTPPPTNPPITIPPLPGPNPASNPSATLTLFGVAREVLLPTVLAIVIAGIAIIALVVLQGKHSPQLYPTSLPTACLSCGGAVTPVMAFCPTCGALLSQGTVTSNSESANRPLG